MTEHDEISSVDDAALASTTQTEPMENEAGADAPAPSSQPEDRTGRVQQLIRDKRTAEDACRNQRGSGRRTARALPERRPPPGLSRP